MKKYKDVYLQFKKYWPYIREVDDCLAVWLEEAYPNHLVFQWEPLDENRVSVTLYFYKSKTELSSQVIEVPVDELGPLVV